MAGHLAITQIRGPAPHSLTKAPTSFSRLREFLPAPEDVDRIMIIRNCAPSSLFVASVLLGLLLAIGCKDPATEALERKFAASAKERADYDQKLRQDRARAEAEIRRQLPGRWVGKTGLEGNPFRATMTMDVRGDRTFTLLNEMRLPESMGGDQTNESSGSWAMTKDNLTLTVERTASGRPVPGDQRELRFVVYYKAGPPTVIDSLNSWPVGPTFQRVPDGSGGE